METGGRTRSSGELGEVGGGIQKSGLGEVTCGGELTPPPHLQCCIDLEHGVLRLKAPLPELPFLPWYQEPGQ